MREFITLVEAAESIGILRKNIIDLINATEDDVVLKRVLKVLDSGDLDRRVVDIISTDQDAQQFIQKIVNAFVSIDADKETKESFLRQYPKGILDPDRLLDGSPHSFRDLLGSDFAVDMFKELCGESGVGVGAGEKALAIMSPRVKWTGKKAGGGDITVDGKPIEVKTRVKKGGRWIDATKFDMDLAGIKDAILGAIPKNANLNINPGGVKRIGIPLWIDKIRPVVNPQRLSHLTKTIADLTFKHTDANQYQQALASGSEADIKEAIMHVGYNNYRAAAKFEGILMLDLPHGLAHYFEDYKDIRDHINIGTFYIYSQDPREIMPQTALHGGKPVKTRMRSKADKPVTPAQQAAAPRPERAPAVPNKLDTPAPITAIPPTV